MNHLFKNTEAAIINNQSRSNKMLIARMLSK